jgi:hypothetical protein
MLQENFADYHVQCRDETLENGTLLTIREICSAIACDDGVKGATNMEDIFA